MIKNVVEKAIVPYNPSSNKIINKDKYNLFAPMATKDLKGIASFDENDFNVLSGKVSLKYSKDKILEECDQRFFKLIEFTETTDNIDTITTRGSYNVTVSTNGAKADGVLYVLTNEQFTIQLLISQDTQRIYQRSIVGEGSWTEWTTTALTSDTANLQEQINAISTTLGELVISNETKLFIILQPGEELPEEGVANKIYFVPDTEQIGNNIFTEYMWINGKWEKIGQTGITVDFSGYVQKADFLVGTVAPTTSTVAPFVGALYVDTTNNNTYQCIAIDTDTPSYTWTKLIRETDYVTGTSFNSLDRLKAGIVSILPWGHGGIDAIAGRNGVLRIIRAGTEEIDNRVYNTYFDGGSNSKNICCPIVPAFLDYAVMKALADCKETSFWTDDTTVDGVVTKGTKTKACETIGAIPQPSTVAYPHIYNILARNSTGEWFAVSVDAGDGLTITSQGRMAVSYASEAQITSRTQKPMSADKLDFVVLEALTNPKIVWTDEKKASARELLGITAETFTFTLEDGTVVTKKILIGA